MSDSKWEKYQLQEKVERVLGKVGKIKGEEERPFLTAYQIAILFAHEYPQLVQELGYAIGGKDIGEHHTLTSYLAERLSSLAKKSGSSIERAFLSHWMIQTMQFRNKGEFVISSFDGRDSLSMFRLKD